MLINNIGQQFTYHYKSYLERQASVINHAPTQIRKKIQNYSFLLKDKIGRGFSSTVYKGINDQTGGQVAIKVIELKSLRDQTSRMMLHNEIECMKQLNHKHLLRYQNSFFTVNNCYIITQLCEKGDLLKDIKQKKRYPQETAKKMFYQIYLAYLHFNNAGYVHRDIKPANIFINANDQLKIADFGFSKRRTNIQRQSYNVGTPIYMSPESLSSNIYNQKTDIWALGITLYELVFGEVPFKGKHQKQLKQQIQKCNINFPLMYLISYQLKDLIIKCLTKDSFNRISIKDMQRHPWLSKINEQISTMKMMEQQIKQIRYKQSFIFNQNIRSYADMNGKDTYRYGKIGDIEDKDIRISLPNDAMRNNKTKQYFNNTEISDKQNRKSINGKIQSFSSMQRLKLYQKKSSQICDIQRPSLNQKTFDLNIINSIKDLINKRNQQSLIQIPYRQTLQNKQNIYQQNKPISTQNSDKNQKIKHVVEINLKQQSKNINKIQNLQRIIVLISYFRLLFQIYKKTYIYTQQIYDENIKRLINSINDIFGRELVHNFNFHLKVCTNKENIFNLKQQVWYNFINSNKWEVYTYVIQRYDSKYKNLLCKYSSDQKTQNLEVYSFILCKINSLKRIEQRLLIKQKYILTELIYLLFHFLNFYKFVISNGWNSFTQKYINSDKIVLQQFNVSIVNYIEISNRNKEKIKETFQNKYGL